MGDDLELASSRDHVWAQAVDGTPDLVHLRPAIRTFLVGIDEQLIVAVVLMGALLETDAFR